jgi:peptidoglycan hydrolase-like amidase
MKLACLLALPFTLVLLFAPAAPAQSLAGSDLPTIEDQQLEDDHIRMRAEHGESHASGMRPELGPATLGNPTQAVTIVRVGLSYSFTATGVFSEFNTRHHPWAEISHTAGTVHLIDESTGKQIVDIEPGTITRVTRDSDTGYDVTVGGAFLGTFDGPLFFRPTDGTNFFRMEHMRRSYNTQIQVVPSYRGAIQLAHGGSTSPDRLHVVNVVELEDYVRGVVANESIASFHFEALKAQAVAARGYAIANLRRFSATFPYGIDDSTQSQVYRGVISEHPRAVIASDETIGLVASYEGRIISTLYSSSMGGHTDDNEWIFNVPSNQWPGTNGVPYLRGIYDGDAVPPPDTSTDSGLSAFWKASPLPTIYDDCGRVGNRFSRWRFVLTGAQIRAKLSPAPPAGVNISDVQITRRMPKSGRAAEVTITLSDGTKRFVRGWDPLRLFFRPAVGTPALCGTTTIGANFTLNNPSVFEVAKNTDGTVSNLTVWGGGWGHNVGMSQYGGQGRARAGQSFLEILNAYYTNADIGSYPIDIGHEPGSGPPLLRQVFYAPATTGVLYVRNAVGLRKLVVHVNGTSDFTIGEEDLADGSAVVDLSGYLTVGLNTVHYSAVGKGKATVSVVVD